MSIGVKKAGLDPAGPEPSGDVTQGDAHVAPRATVLGLAARMLRRRGSAATARNGGFSGRAGLIMLGAAVPMAEAAVVNAVTPSARVLAPQVTALAPLAVFHDLRWLFGFGGTWPRFVLALAGLVVGRSVLDAALAWLAWPRGQPRPRPAVLLGSGAILTLCAGLLMSPLVTLTFGVALLPFSWPFLGTLPALILFALVLSHGATASGWWRTMPTLRSAEWLVADFLVLSLAAVVIGRLAAVWAVPVAGLTGIINARAWYGVATSLAVPRASGRLRLAARRVPVARRLPVAPAAAVLAVALVIGVARAGFVVAASSPARITRAAPAAARRPPAGPGTPGRRSAGGRPPCWRSGASGPPAAPRRPRSASSRATRSRSSSPTAAWTPTAGRCRPGRPPVTCPCRCWATGSPPRCEHLHAETGRPVDLVAESEGTLGIYAMLARHPDVPVGSIVLLSPIVAPGQVSYPADAPAGRGAVPGYALQAVVWFIGGLSPFGTSGAEQLISSVDRSGAQYAAEAAEQTRRHPIRWMAVVPLADSLTMPSCQLPSNTLVVPALHGGLLGNTEVQRAVRSFLGGASVRAQPPLQDAAEIVSQAAAAWRMPELPSPSPPCPVRGS